MSVNKDEFSSSWFDVDISCVLKWEQEETLNVYIHVQWEKKTLTINILMMNQKVFYSSNHLGRQTEVDVNRRAQTHAHTDRTGSFELFVFIDLNQIFLFALHSLHHDADVHISTHFCSTASRSVLCVSMATRCAWVHNAVRFRLWRLHCATLHMEVFLLQNSPLLTRTVCCVQHACKWLHWSGIHT